MKKRKRFDGGGSVMDKPDRDMRDPAYRRQLEREQALELSAPETALPIGRALSGAKTAFNAIRNFTKKVPPKTLTKDIEIGKYAYDNDRHIDVALRRLPENEREAAIQKMRDVAKQKYDQKTRFKNKIQSVEAANKTINNASTSLIAEGIAKIREADKEEMKSGGKVKAKSASSRGDGIAQRGKTKGRII